MAEKELPPTPRRIRRALEEGEDIQSQEIYGIASTIAILAAVLLMVSGLGTYLMALFRFGYVNWQRDPVQLFFLGIYDRLVDFLGPMAIAAFAGSIVAYFVNRRRMPKFFAIKLQYHPIENFKRKFKKYNILRTLKNWIIFNAFIGLALYLAYLSTPDLIAAMFCTNNCGLDVSEGLALICFFSVMTVLLVGALLDLVSSRAEFHENIKMTHQEVKQDNKEEFGSPEIRGQRKALAREISQS